ncbi:hypothetical protein ACHAW5_002088 [Stephanodiscus triporus]|uniref:Plastid lipid-associated protein/fibrillin conserved domain-containing protein n=1 Tax=Stephanodiscus triporus TaxID=2934178 RepID=A0ABD3MTK3_9STRA
MLRSPLLPLTATAALLLCPATASTGGRMTTTTTTTTLAFQNLLPRMNLPSLSSISSLFSPPPVRYGDVELEDRLLAAIECTGGGGGGGEGEGEEKKRRRRRRLDISDEVSDLVNQLESSARSVPRPAIAPELYGRWRLLRTSNADTASPIQRKAVDATRFDIYQDIVVLDDDDDDVDEGGDDEGKEEDKKTKKKKKKLLVRQIVEFGKGGGGTDDDNINRLCVDALASTSAYPLEELTEREGTGRILGFNVLGVSKVGKEADEDPNRPDSRVRFVFDEGRFEFGNKITLPYPVPFRNPLFRDAVKGWIDVTYLSDRVRISRGNKGTTFVLRKVE